MNAKSWKSLFLAGFLFFPPPAQGAVFNPEHFTLANGLEIVIVRGALSPAVAHMVWYKVGAADDPAEKSGLAHYLEHLMFKGTASLPAGGFSASIAAQGGKDNAFTGHDATAFYVTAAADRLPLLMQMEADRMRSLRIAAQEALPERDVVSSERQERTENDPHGMFQEKLRAALFSNHPYGRPVIGWREEIDSLTPDDARAFYEKHYAPNNAILAISGDVSTQDVLRLAAATFGRLPPATLPPRAKLPQAAPPTVKEISETDPRVKQAYFVREFVVPSATTNAKEALALEVLAEILGGGEVGLLHKKFVIEQRAASGVELSYDSAVRGETVFFLAATPIEGSNLRKLENEMQAYLTRLARTGFSAAEIRAAQKRLTDGAIFARDRLMAPANILGEALALGQKIEDVENGPAAIQSIRAAEVTATLRKLLASPRQIVGFMEPKEATK